MLFANNGADFETTEVSMRRLAIIAITLGCVVGWAADWLTDGFDIERTNWQRDEKILSLDTVKNMKLLW